MQVMAILSMKMRYDACMYGNLEPTGLSSFPLKKKTLGGIHCMISNGFSTNCVFNYFPTNGQLSWASRVVEWMQDLKDLPCFEAYQA